MYESSILCAFGADDELVDSGFMIGATGLEVTGMDETEGFGFAFAAAAALSLLTRTDAGI